MTRPPARCNGCRGQPGGVGQAAGRLLLRVPAGRAVHSARLPQMCFGPILQRRPLRSVPSRRAAASGLVSGLSGLGCVSSPQLALLELPMVEHPLPARRLPILRPAHPRRRTAGVPAVHRAGPHRSRTRPGHRPSAARTAMASSCSSPTCASNGPAPRGSTRSATRPTAASALPSAGRGGSCLCSTGPRPDRGSRAIPDRADSDLIRHCTGVVRDHAARHGWSKRQTNDVIRSLRLLQVLQDTPGAKINASEVAPTAPL